MYIASSLNEYYLPYTYTMLLSLFLSNPGERFNIFLLEADLSDHAKNALQKLAANHASEIRFLKTDPLRIRSALQGKTEWPPEASFRLLITDLLPSHVDRILYIDGDVVVINNITDLYNVHFDDYELLAGHDFFSCGNQKNEALEIHESVFKNIINEGAYFNSGVLVYNINKLRKKKITSRYFDTIHQLNCHLPYPDQDILNFVHYRHVKYFDVMKYNFQGQLAVSYNGGYDADRIRREVCILHYIDKKPWNGGDHIHYDAENIWWDYALQTPFANELMTKYIRSSMDEYIHDRVTELRKNNEILQEELKRVSTSVKKLLSNLSAT